MDAGVPIKEMIAGIAMGLVTSGSKYTILTDIQGLEDHYGDMDFKVCGSAKGITALQMDIKIGGINAQIMAEARLAAERVLAAFEFSETLPQTLPVLYETLPAD